MKVAMLALLIVVAMLVLPSCYWVDRQLEALTCCRDGIKIFTYTVEEEVY